MNTGEFKMAPLSDFAVTFTDHRKKPDVNMSWDEWYDYAGRPHFDMEDNVTSTLVIFNMKKPEGINVVMPQINPPYELVWKQT